MFTFLVKCLSSAILVNKIFWEHLLSFLSYLLVMSDIYYTALQCPLAQTPQSFDVYEDNLTVKHIINNRFNLTIIVIIEWCHDCFDQSVKFFIKYQKQSKTQKVFNLHTFKKLQPANVKLRYFYMINHSHVVCNVVLIYQSSSHLIISVLVGWNKRCA